MCVLLLPLSEAGGCSSALNQQTMLPIFGSESLWCCLHVATLVRGGLDDKLMPSTPSAGFAPYCAGVVKTANATTCDVNRQVLSVEELIQFYAFNDCNIIGQLLN